jgi:hypothetical protein
MSDTVQTLDAPVFRVLEGIEFHGQVNTPDASLLAHIRHSIRLGYPQVKPQAPQPDRVVLVGGGPSLLDTFDELRALYYEGAKLVTVNGSYQWCLERNLRPSAQILLDARASNARFVEPAVPNCRYLLASQCHPDTWRAVEGRDVWIWHAVGPDAEVEAAMNAYYAGRWMSIGHGPVGGTTVGIRAIALLRTLGFLRFDLFGFDSCYLGGLGHAYAQPENAHDRPYRFAAHPAGHPEQARVFYCAPWQAKQLEDFLQMIRAKGSDFLLNVHGDGLLAFALRSSAEVEWSVDAAATQATAAEGSA